MSVSGDFPDSDSETGINLDNMIIDLTMGSGMFSQSVSIVSRVRVTFIIE